VSAILDSIDFVYTVNDIPSLIRNGTATTTIWIRPDLIGDINGDGKVDSRDLSYALTFYGKYVTDADWFTGSAYLADINRNGVIDTGDILTIANLSIGIE